MDGRFSVVPGRTATYPASGETACPTGTVYLTLVFDHQSLEPVGSKGCYAVAPPLTTFLKTLDSNDLVVAGTLQNMSSDALLDTSAIGGTDHTKDKNQPGGYIAIGVGGATAGTAYENFPVWPNGDATLVTRMWPFATGIVQEDQDGNYNYESSEVLEYTVDPFTKDPSADHPGTITIGTSLAASIANPALKGYRFLPPALPSGSKRWILAGGGAAGHSVVQQSVERLHPDCAGPERWPRAHYKRRHTLQHRRFGLGHATVRLPEASPMT